MLLIFIGLSVWVFDDEISEEIRAFLFKIRFECFPDDDANPTGLDCARSGQRSPMRISYRDV